MKKYFRSTPPPHAWSDSRYRSFSQLFPANTYVPQRLTLNSLSAYHSGQGGGTATCFISFPEYVSVPAKATEVTAATPNRANISFFILFLLRLSVSNKTKLTTSLDAAILSRSSKIARNNFRSFLGLLSFEFRPGICVGD